MRVGVDATALLDPPTGIGVFTRRLLEGLVDHRDNRADESEPITGVVAYAASWRGRDRFGALVPDGVTAVDRPMPARPVRALWQRFDHPVIERWTGPLSVAHGPNFIVPPSSAHSEVVTVHDLTTVHHPEWCHPATLAFPGLVQRAIDRGAWVHTVSAHVAGQVRDHFDVDPGRVVAIHNGVDRPSPVNHPSTTAEPPFVLALGTIEPRKDLPGLVDAFDLVADENDEVRLIIAGPDGWGGPGFGDALTRSRHRDRIERTGWVDDGRRASLLRDATVLAYPSRYEGFGLPPLEAMAVGTPVVATLTGALPEVLGPAADLVAVGDVESLATALNRVLDDERHRAGLTARGLERAQRYTWDACVDGIVDLYRRVCGF